MANFRVVSKRQNAGIILQKRGKYVKYRNPLSISTGVRPRVTQYLTLSP